MFTCGITKILLKHCSPIWWYMLHNKEFIWSLSYVLGRELLNPFWFSWERVSLLTMVGLSDHTWIYVNELHRMGAGYIRKTNNVIKRLGIWVTWYQPNFLQEEEGGWRLSSVKSCTYYEIPIKLWRLRVWLSLLADECISVLRRWHIQIPQGGGLEGKGGGLGLSQTSSYMSLYLWLILTCILCNKTNHKA